MTGILLSAEYWLVAGLLLAAVEVMVPGFFFLGFGIGAAVTAALVWPMAGLLADSQSGWAWPLLFFAVLSVAATLALRRVFARRRPGRRFDDEDVNDLPYRGDRG